MNSYPIASDLSYFVAQKIRQEREDTARGFDCTDQRLRTISGYPLRKLIADPDCGQPDAGDSANPNPLEPVVQDVTPIWQRKGK